MNRRHPVKKPEKEKENTSEQAYKNLIDIYSKMLEKSLSQNLQQETLVN